MNQDEKLSIIKDILLTDEREFVSSIEKKIKILERTVNEKKNLSTKVDPIIEEKLQQFVKEIPDTLGPTITKALKTQIAQAQDDIVEVLAPIIGKMIKKFVVLEMQILSEKIDVQLKKTFSIKGWVKRIKSWFGGIKESDLIIRELSD